MKHNFFLLLTLLICSASIIIAQNEICYSYDASGNRIKRVLRSSQLAKKEPRLNRMYNDKYNITLSSSSSDGHFAVNIVNYRGGIDSYLNVYNVAGLKIYHKNIFGESTDIDISSSANGVYILEIIIGDTKSQFKITKKQ
jgi:hypothetical protein